MRWHVGLALHRQSVPVPVGRDFAERVMQYDGKAECVVDNRDRYAGWDLLQRLQLHAEEEE